jgi:release factor glutamine methyltransferase
MSSSIGAVLADAARRLAAAGCDTPRLDAELLLAEALQVDRVRLVLDRDEPVAGEDAARFEAFVVRREAREPVAYILGRRGFRRLELHVDPRVLIPRPATELLVEVGLTLGPEASVLDVGTGSGAVALALADERPDLAVRGIDVSPDAVEVASANARRLGLAVRFAVADLLDEEPCDAVLANLPYVAAAERLAPEITRYEPAGALFAGADGLDLIRRLVSRVNPGPVGLIALEIGDGQGSRVSGMLDARGWGTVEVLPDLTGSDRVVVGTGCACAGRFAQRANPGPE